MEECYKYSDRFTCNPSQNISKSTSNINKTTSNLLVKLTESGQGGGAIGALGLGTTLLGLPLPPPSGAGAATTVPGGTWSRLRRTSGPEATGTPC
jgi:hypothetical protein